MLVREMPEGLAPLRSAGVLERGELAARRRLGEASEPEVPSGQSR